MHRVRLSSQKNLSLDPQQTVQNSILENFRLKTSKFMLRASQKFIQDMATHVGWDIKPMKIYPKNAGPFLVSGPTTAEAPRF